MTLKINDRNSNKINIGSKEKIKMKAVKVQYTVKADYAETNKQNIAKVMSELRSTHNSDVKYSAFVL